VIPPPSGSMSNCRPGHTVATTSSGSTRCIVRHPPTRHDLDTLAFLMSSPLVAVPAYRLPAGRVAKWDAGGFAVPDTYVLAAQRAGMRPLAVMESEPDAALEVLGHVGGLLLLGGGDLDPVTYGAEGHARVYGVDRDRDAVELALVREALDRAMPVLAICRGLQVLNVALGGTLIQHVPDLGGATEHGVPGGGGTVMHDVNVEAVEHDGPGWMVAVQWHPEDTAADDPAQQALFGGLAEAAGRFASGRSA
jgi:putative glutamine amidotransferase